MDDGDGAEYGGQGPSEEGGAKSVVERQVDAGVGGQRGGVGAAGQHGGIAGDRTGVGLQGFDPVAGPVEVGDAGIGSDFSTPGGGPCDTGADDGGRVDVAVGGRAGSRGDRAGRQAGLQDGQRIAVEELDGIAPGLELVDPVGDLVAAFYGDGPAQLATPAKA